jgi:hypothetical protein
MCKFLLGKQQEKSNLWNLYESLFPGINASGINASGINASGITASGINASGITASGINASGESRKIVIFFFIFPE